MKRETIPLLHPLGSYDGTQTADWMVHAICECQRLVKFGVWLHKLPDTIFEAQVFYHFIHAASGNFSTGTSVFSGNWRYMPAAERMARKIGADALAAELSEKWA